MKNIVFISSFVPGLDYYAQNERLGQLRSSLLSLGLEFHSVYINKRHYLMVTTNQLKLMFELAKSFQQDTIYISDRRRTTFAVSLDDNSPTKLGTLKRSLSTDSSGTNTAGGFCLIVNEDGSTYHYYCEQA